MTNCTQESFQFPVLKRRIVEANFQGGDITSDGGVLLLQQVDRRLGLSEAVARTLDDPRRQASIDHNSLSLLRQRVYALALGYEDLNDHETLRLDLAIQTALGRTEELASSPTLCRWENRADRETAGRMHEVIVEQFIASFKTAPKKLILDFDATDDVVHGNQEDRFFHGYYDHYCFLPLYVFCRKRLVRPAPEQDRRRQACGRSWLCWPATGLATSQNYLPWRLRFLPLADVVVVRAQQRGLHCRHRQEQAPERPHRTAATRCTRRRRCQGALVY